ncbi:MAG: GNAT family N-acetyltransferase [Acidimicrobiia bacterium]
MDVRVALPAEVEAICEFGASYIPQHYGPLLGAEAARAQVDNWWNRDRMERAVDEGRVVVAEDGGMVLGVGEWSLYEGVPVIWKLYVNPLHRGEGTGPRLIDAIIDEVPDEMDRIRVETFAVNRKAVAFYEREGFREIRTVEHGTDPAMTVVWLERSLDQRGPAPWP